MNLLVQIITAIFFILTGVFLIFLAFSLFQLYRIEKLDDEELDAGFEEITEEENGPEAPEIFKHSYDLQLLYLARERALGQFVENCKKPLLTTKSHDLEHAFLWVGSNEGFEYWNDLYGRYYDFLEGKE